MKNIWLSVEDAATYLGVDHNTIYRWIKNHNLSTYKVGRLWKFKAEELDKWVKEVGSKVDSD